MAEAAESSKRKMDWTNEHDILLCREVIVNDPYEFKTGSRERGQCLDKIADILNAIQNPWFKVDQRSIRDRLKKLLKAFITKKNAEERASGINPEYSELDDLLNDINERKHEGEIRENQNSEEKNKKVDKERAEAEQVRRMSMERLSETKKRLSTSASTDELEVSPPTKRPRSSGGDTIMYLREKSEKDFALREEELRLKRAELEAAKERDSHLQQQSALMLQQCQQQSAAMMLLVQKVVQKLR